MTSVFHQRGEPRASTATLIDLTESGKRLCSSMLREFCLDSNRRGIDKRVDDGEIVSGNEWEKEGE